MKTPKTGRKIVLRKKRHPMARAFDLLANLPEDLASIRQGNDHPQERFSEVGAKIEQGYAAARRGELLDAKQVRSRWTRRNAHRVAKNAEGGQGSGRT